jgi:hypothetical protein
MIGDTIDVQILYGVSTLPWQELCPDCLMPDNCGDCNHTRLSDADLASLGLYDDSPGPEGRPLLRWATPVEVEEELNGVGVPGAEWIPAYGDHDQDASDLAVPR